MPFLDNYAQKRLFGTYTTSLLTTRWVDIFKTIFSDLLILLLCIENCTIFPVDWSLSNGLLKLTESNEKRSKVFEESIMQLSPLFICFILRQMTAGQSLECHLPVPLAILYYDGKMLIKQDAKGSYINKYRRKKCDNRTLIFPFLILVFVNIFARRQPRFIVSQTC